MCYNYTGNGWVCLTDLNKKKLKIYWVTEHILNFFHQKAELRLHGIILSLFYALGRQFQSGTPFSTGTARCLRARRTPFRTTVGQCHVVLFHCNAIDASLLHQLMSHGWMHTDTHKDTWG